MITAVSIHTNYCKMEPTDEESLAPDTKKRKVTFNTFKKWKTEMDKECQTITCTWLDCDSELVGTTTIAKKIRCIVCTKIQGADLV